MYQKVVAISDDSDFKSSDLKLEIKSNHLRFRFRMKERLVHLSPVQGSGAKELSGERPKRNVFICLP